jgi:hypothetical protein
MKYRIDPGSAANRHAAYRRRNFILVENPPGRSSHAKSGTIYRSRSDFGFCSLAYGMFLGLKSHGLVYRLVPQESSCLYVLNYRSHLYLNPLDCHLT